MSVRVGDIITDLEWGWCCVTSSMLRMLPKDKRFNPERVVIMTIKSPRGAELIICEMVGLFRTEKKLNKHCAAVRGFMKRERAWDKAHGN